MAFPVTTDSELPRFTVVSKYEITRVGLYPVVRVTYMQCVYLTEDPVTVESVEDVNTDSLFERLTIPALANRTDLVGHLLSTGNSVDVGVIASVETFEATPAVLDVDDVTVLTPAVNSARITLVAGTATDFTGQDVAVVGRMPVRTTAYRAARAGKVWDLVLHGANPAAMARMAAMLGNVHFAAVKEVLAQLGITTITDAALGGALQALASKGTNIDGLLAAEGEKLELSRLAGTAPYITVYGDAPLPE